MTGTGRGCARVAGPAWADGSQAGVVSEPQGQGFLWKEGGRGSVGNMASLMKGAWGWSCHPHWQDMGWNKVQKHSLQVAVGVLWSFKWDQVGI